ncbi:GDP-mannose 4,6-dehydratase [Nocardioides piscis]|uniref:GDP-mannose 4,6-dehydratase n=1 Tax=Nocardioides piscis TaxID=2714938 RepID=A0A6G7YES8_9ACTN|nr:GDP-mannose 4,6-dehydratase [Nocardioides piscis]QIK75270.1 GDP-mannose 4,6-dehydratase [Nocardioides piscis]
MTRALITGVGGQDGSYLAERLVADGVEVHALVLDEGRRPPYCPSEVILHLGDLADVEATRRLVVDLAPDEIYNLAAISSVAQSWSEPDLVSRVNGFAAVALLESARQVGEHVRFVQASSAEIFGEPATSPQDEDTPVAPTNPYGAAKAYAHLSVAVQRRRGLHASSLVLYNHESPRRPERFVTRKITAGVAAIAQGRADELVLGNLSARRDWGWAPDYVEAMLLAARADEPQDFVIATGVAHSVRDFVAAAFRHAGIEDWEGLVRSDPGLTRPADATELRGDATRARERLGWRPSMQFDEIVIRMVDAEQ